MMKTYTEEEVIAILEYIKIRNKPENYNKGQHGEYVHAIPSKQILKHYHEDPLNTIMNNKGNYIS